LKISRDRRAEAQKLGSPEAHENCFQAKNIALLLCCSAALFFTVSCAPKHIEMPTHEGIGIREAIAELKNTKAVEAVLLVQYEKNDSAMSGDASVSITENSLDMRLYYLGFLAGEIHENNGIIKSKPKLDNVKSAMLVDGLKNSFLWWNITDFIVQEREGIYELRNSYRKVLIRKQTLLPVEQTIELYNGDKLYIYYNAPEKIQAGEEMPQSYIDSLSPIQRWYQSSVRIEYRNQIVRVAVKSYWVKK
jgi:hypothetical protein